MSKAFKIAPGRYDIPGIGRVDAQKEVSDETAFAIYKLSRRVFPWITLGPGAGSFLKKQKLTVKEIASLVQNATSSEEIEILSGLSDSKPLARIIETKLQALEYDKK
jgi:hypothetical protein